MRKAILIFTATVVLVIITMLLCMLLFSSCDNNSNYDKETLIMYIFLGYNAIYSLILMLDGKPLLYNKDKEKE